MRHLPLQQNDQRLAWTLSAAAHDDMIIGNGRIDEANMVIITSELKKNRRPVNEYLTTPTVPVLISMHLCWKFTLALPRN